MKLYAHLFAVASMTLVFGCASPKKSAAPAASPSPTVSPSPTPAKGSPGAAVTGAGNLEKKCENSDDKRAITVVPSASGCEVHYTKAGGSNVVATSANGTAHCDSVQSKMVSNLEAAGFKCQ